MVLYLHSSSTLFFPVNMFLNIHIDSTEPLDSFELTAAYAIWIHSVYKFRFIFHFSYWWIFSLYNSIKRNPGSLRAYEKVLFFSISTLAVLCHSVPPLPAG